ncbi:MAG: hypothetical protein IPJ75_20290 [Ignavibacteriales bacterium]|nr:hypothetical protein [Ignavibacteriales bacterium]
METQTDTYFSREISDRVKVISCLTTLPNIIHSDSPSETIASSEWNTLKKSGECFRRERYCHVWGDEQDAQIKGRRDNNQSQEATIGILPKPVRALRDGTNGFERSPPRCRQDVPGYRSSSKDHAWKELQESEKGCLYQSGIGRQNTARLVCPKEHIEKLAMSPFAKIFENAIGELKVDHRFASRVLIEFPVRLKKHLPITQITLKFTIHFSSVK